jgi:hypothetical protein
MRYTAAWYYRMSEIIIPSPAGGKSSACSIDDKFQYAIIWVAYGLAAVRSVFDIVS